MKVSLMFKMIISILLIFFFFVINAIDSKILIISSYDENTEFSLRQLEGISQG